MADIKKIQLPDGSIYDLVDSGAFRATGGTVSGPMTVESYLSTPVGTSVYGTVGTAGESGYVLLAKITLKGQNADTPIEFKITDRGAGFSANLSLAIQGNAGIVAAVSSFTGYGDPDVIKRCYAYVVSDTEIDIVFEKRQAYDRVEVMWLGLPIYMRSRVTITWEGTMFPSFGSITTGKTQASYASIAKTVGATPESAYITTVAELLGIIEDMTLHETRLIMISGIQHFTSSKISGSLRGYITKTDSVQSDIMGVNGLSGFVNVRVKNADASFLSCYKAALTQI